MSNFDFDFFVIGAGSGGVRASRIAAQLGAKVAVAEDLYLGGTCVNVGCNKNTEIQRLNKVYGNILGNSNVEIIEGRASIAGPNTVLVNGTRYKAANILIAVGGWPRKPSFPGAEYAITSNEVFHLETLPKRILVQGGGYVAAEFAGIFQGLGCETELSYRGPLFLRGFDEEVRWFVAEQMAAKGITLSFNTDIAKVEKNADGSFAVELSNGERREVDAVFSAVGRVPKIEGLGLENTAVQTNTSGEIMVNENFETHEPGVFAVGDVVGRMQLTPVALAEGMALAKYLFSGEAIKVDYKNIATAIFTQPNIACVGYSEEEAQKDGIDYAVYRSSFRALKQTLGGLPEKVLMKLLVDKKDDKVIGAHMVGESAGEILQSIAVAIQCGATKAHFDKTIGIHPTAAEEFVTMRADSEKFQSKLS